MNRTPNPFDNHADDYDSWYDQNQALYELELDAIRAILPPSTGGRRRSTRRVSRRTSAASRSVWSRR